jgi:hypothetical protein
VEQATVDQHHRLRPQLAAQFAGELQPTGATANNHEFTLQAILLWRQQPPVSSVVAIVPAAIVMAPARAMVVALIIAMVVPVIASVIAPVIVTIIIAAIVTMVIAVWSPIAMARMVTRHIFIVVPPILHEIHSLITGVISMAMFTPVAGMARRHAQVDRRSLDITHWAFDDHRLAVHQLRRRVIADIDAAIKAGLANADGNPDIGGKGRSG